MASNPEKDIYSLAKTYVELIFTKGRPILDYELNELQKIEAGLREIFLKSALPDGPVGDGFLVESTGNANEVRVRSGFIFDNGKILYLPQDEVISSLSTPSGSDRTDYMYLEWYTDEVDSVGDPDIIDVSNIGAETATRLKLQISILKVEGGNIPAPSPGITQYRIATFNRLDGVDILDASQIVDDRVTTGQCYVSSGGKVQVTGAFSFDVESVSGLVGGNQFSVSGTPLAIGLSEVRYLYISNLEALTLAASFPTSYHVPLAIIQSDGVGITSVTDMRRFAPMSGSGGSTPAESIIPTTTLVSVDKYDLVFASGVNTVDLADSSSDSTVPVLGLSLDEANPTEAIRVFTSGLITNPSWAFSSGAELYLSTSGGITEIAPVALGTVIQKVGIALTPTTIFFKPDQTYGVNGGVSFHAQNTDLGTDSSDFTLRYGLATPLVGTASWMVNRGTGNDPVGFRFVGPSGPWELTQDGTNWYPIGTAPEVFREDTVGDGIQTLFTLSQPYTVGTNNLLVFSGATLMTNTVDYVETSSTEVTFTTAPLNGESISFIVGLGSGNTIIDAAHDHAFDTFVANGIDDTFTLSNLPLANSTVVSLNGQVQTEGVHYNVSGSDVVFITIPGVSERVTVHYAH